jgi:4-hydroxymandelate oxidase
MSAACHSSESRRKRQVHSRRRFLELLQGSTLSALLPSDASPYQLEAAVMNDPGDALNVMDFEAAARRSIPPAHFGYIASGVDDEVTLKANRDGFNRYQLRPRRLVDVSRVDLRTELFGSPLESPILIAPVGSQKAFHPDGELATARAARVKHTQMILSTVTTCGVEDVAQAAGGPIWYQLYPTSQWKVTEHLVRRAEAAGCPVLVLTIDLPAGRNPETLQRFKRLDTRKCSSCHGTGPEAQRPEDRTIPLASNSKRKPMFDGIDMSGVTIYNAALTWDSVRRLRALTRMKLVLKGIMTREDAQLCCEHGVDGMIVSNHGGRAEDSGRATIECLPEIMDAVRARMPVLIDSGFRRGTDVFKALALGARAVCIGRPYVWGLGAFGQAGVERVLDLLHRELELVMKQCGTTSVNQISRSYIATRN